MIMNDPPFRLSDDPGPALVAKMALELRRERERNAALTLALRTLIRDTGCGVFAATGSETRAAEAALLLNDR